LHHALTKVEYYKYQALKLTN